MSTKIELRIKRHDWRGARRLLRSALCRAPGDHWLLTRLSLTHYEQRNYRRALAYSRRAYTLAPWCPLVLWDHAGDLDMLGRKREAIAIYRRLVKRGERAIAAGRCGEGLAWARGVVADSWYRLARCYTDLGRRKLATEAYRQHVRMRGPGCRSIYPLGDVRRQLRRLQQRSRVA